MKNKDRFEQALLKLVGRKGSNNMFVVLSTSRPSPNVFTKKVLTATDLKIVHQLASEQDWLYVTGHNLIDKITQPGEKAVFYRDRYDILQPFSDAYVRAIENWEASDFNANSRPDYSTYTDNSKLSHDRRLRFLAPINYLAARKYRLITTITLTFLFLGIGIGTQFDQSRLGGAIGGIIGFGIGYSTYKRIMNFFMSLTGSADS